MDELYLGPVPADEPCAQTVDPDYGDKARKECRAYCNQLIRKFDEPPGNAHFKVKGETSHNGQRTYEVVVVFNDNSKAEVEFAFYVEANTPMNWDEEAIKELKSHGLK